MQNVDLGGPYGVVAFPDEFTPEQIVAEYDSLEKARKTPPTLSTLDYAKNVGGRLLRGAAGMVASIPESLAIASSGLSRLTGTSGPGPLVGEGDPTRAEDRASYQLGQAIRRGAEYIAPTNPALNESFLASKLPEGVGSAVGFMAGGLAGKALKVPAWLAIGGLGSASSGADFYHDAKASGADEGTAQLASVIGNAVGTSEAFPLARMMHRLDGITGGTFSKFVIEAGKDTIEEALQEGAQQLAQNFTAQQLYDKDRSLFNDVATNTGVGGATGFLMSALTQALGIPIGRSNVRRQSRDESRERIARVIEEREANATQSGAVVTPTGQEEGVRQEAGGQVYLRGAPISGLEAEAGAIANAPTTTIPTPVTQTTQATAPIVPVESAAVPEGAAAIETPAAGVQPLTKPQPVVQDAVSSIYGIEQGPVGWQEIESEAPAPPIAIPRLQQLVAGITSQWSNAPTVTVVQSVDQLPENVKARAASLGLNRVAAVADNGQVWMVANNITDEERAKRLLLHESVGHLGVESVFATPQEFTSFMQGVAQRHASTPLGQEIRAIYGNDPIAFGKEIVAKLAENPGADPTLWQQIVAAVRNWARRVFKVEINDNDIRVLLQRGRRAVEAGLVRVEAATGGTSLAVEETVPYGFWISSGGQMIPVHTEAGHEDEAIAIIKSRGGSFAPTADLYKLVRGMGYVRGVFDRATRTLFLDVSGSSMIPSAKAKQAATDYAIEHNINAAVEYPGRREVLHDARETSFALNPANQSWNELPESTRDALRGPLAESMWQRNFAEAKRNALAHTIAWRDRVEAAAKAGQDVPIEAARSYFNAIQKKEFGADPQALELLRQKYPGEFESFAPDQPGSTSFALNPSGSTSVFQNRAAVDAAISNPGLSTAQVQEAEAMASVQSSMVTPDMATWLQEPPADKVEKKAKVILKPLLDVAMMSPWPRPLSSFPEGERGSQERRTKELAGWSQLVHHGFHRSLAQTIASDIAVAQGNLTEAMSKTATTTHLQHKANFLTATFNRLLTGMRVYLVDKKNATRGNLQAQWDQRIVRAEGRLNEQEQSPTAVRHALSAIARTIPDNLLTPTITLELGSNVDAGPLDTAAFNQPVIDWAVQNGALNTVVSDSVRDWLLTDDGTGQPALSSYTELLEDLRALKDILNNEQQVNNDIDAFEAWFKNAATGTGVSAKDFAEKYFKFRTGRDSALRIIAANERDINRYDLNLRANVTARDRLASMMSDPGYTASVLDAKAQADIVIRSLYDPDKPLEPAVGLINRDRAVGTHILKGPLSQFNYVVDLHPSAAGEAQNIENLSAFVAEARAWATANAATDPLKAEEYNDLAGYIEGHLMSASLNPKQGFTMTRVRIPFTNIRMPIDPFDGLTSLTGLGWSFHTVRDVIERIGGRVVNQAFKDAAVLDTTMRKVEAVDQHPEYGRAAQTQAVLKALESHGWSIDQRTRWNQRVAEPVLASGQNRLSPVYEVGDVIVGADATLTAEDAAALRLMKRWTDAINATAPHMIEDRLSELGISRKQIGNGKYTGPRVDADWTENFVKKWNSAPTDAAKAELLTGEDEFLDVVLGYLAEFNSEFGKMNPASSEKSPLFLLYRRLADTEKSGVEKFRDWGEVVDFLATTGTTMPMPGTSTPMFPDYVTAAQKVNETLFSEISAFIKAFDDNVLHYESKAVWGGVPPASVKAVSGRNAFTTARRRLVAPSTFYTYSMATAAQQQKYVGSLRSLLNLQLLQSGYEAQRALEGKKLEMEQRIDAIVKTGITDRKARRQVQKETAKERQLGEIRYSLSELSIALKSIEKAFGNVERYENAATEYYEHAGIAAANSFFSGIKASLLSSLQAITTNTFSGALLGPAVAHWQMGQFGRAMGDIVIQPALMAKTVMKRVSALVEGNPMMSRLLRTHAPLWDDLAEAVIKGAADWRRVQHIAQSTGMVNPYNLGTVLKNMGALKRTAGRFTSEDPNHIAEAVNIAMSAPGIRHATEGLKAFVPREFDNAINYMMVINFDREVEMLRKLGWVAFQNRESSAAATSADWKDLSKPENLLTPGDLGLKTNKALEWFRQLFIPLGSLDGVLRDYYERTKTMTPDQRSEEPLLSDDDHAALALQYAAKSNVSVETNRPYSLKGKGSDGFMRNVVGTFMGWGINMMHQLSKGLQTHSKDKQFPAIANAMIGIATIVLLMAAVGAWNWEFGDELTKKLYDVSSARVQLGNIKDWRTGLLYFAQALVNTVPMIGSSIGGLFGVAYTGRGNPFDMTSLSPHIGFVAGIYNTVRRISQTGDATLPLTDFTRQWVPMSKILLNRIPTVRGLVDQQNAVRSMNASAPPGTEIKWGKRGGGDVKYSPANDEVQRLIASAYEVAAHGGDPAIVQQRLQEAIAAYVATGRTPDDAVKALTSALSSKEPIRVLTGREMTPEEEAKWVSRMTKDQKADYDKSVAAWNILSAATGKDFNMVTTKGPGGGGGSSASTPSRAIGLNGGSLRPPGSGLAGSRIGRGIGTRRRGLPGRRRSGIVGTSRRRIGGPRIGRVSTRRRVGSSRRRGYAIA